MDNPTLDQVLDSAWDDNNGTVSSDTDGGDDTVQGSQPEPSVEPKPVEVSEPKVTDKPTEENFSSVDPESLPEELKNIYKSLQADYTRKRQLETAKLREYETKIKQLEDKLTGGEQEDLSNLTPEEQIRELARQEVKSQQAEAYRSTAKVDLENLDSRLNENHPDFKKFEWLDGMVRAQLDHELSLYEEEHGTPVGFDHVGKAKSLLNSFDAYVEAKAKAYLQEQSRIAKEKAEKTSKASPDVTNPTTRRSGNMSLDDAIETAFGNS